MAVVGLATPRGAQRALRTADLLDRYSAGDWDSVLADIVSSGPPQFRGLLQDFERDSLNWAGAMSTAKAAAKSEVAAAFILEVARTYWQLTLDDSLPQSSSQGGRANVGQYPNPGTEAARLASLLAWTRQRLRITGAREPFDRAWLVASTELLDGIACRVGGRAAAFLPGYLADGRARYPNEGWLDVIDAKRLARSLPQFIRARREIRASDPQSTEAEARGFEAARERLLLIHEPVAARAEARLYLGALGMATSRREEAQLDLDESLALSARTDPSQSCTRYVALFLRARLAEMNGQRDDAEHFYRDALGVVPHAQAAVTALASILYLSNRTEEASELVLEQLARETHPADPWMTFLGNGCESHDQIVRLRKAIQP